MKTRLPKILTIIFLTSFLFITGYSFLNHLFIVKAESNSKPPATVRGNNLSTQSTWAFTPNPASALLASITVTTTADTIDAAGTCPSVTLGSLPGPDGQTSLREAICAANSNPGADTITFSINGTFALTGAVNEDNGGGGDYDIKQSLSIQGNGAANTILDGSGIERIFDVFPSAASTFDLSNMTLQNGDTRTVSFREGGAIYLHNNVTTTINSCQIINNFSGANGAIENRGNFTINNSVISNNQTIPASGTVVGGGMHNAGTLSINNTTISNNTVRGEGGGIATSTGAAVVVSISTSTISGNTASVTGGGNGNGGGISTTGNQGTINITNCTISGNRSDNNGGGTYFVTPGGGTGNATLNNVTITNNTADNDNNGAGAGGGLAQVTAAVTLRNTIVAGNFNSIASVRDDISGAVVASSSYNLIGDGTGSSGITNGVNNNQVGSGASPVNPLLGSLVNNGGSTETHALQSGSPALDTANNAICAPTDQRGIARPFNGVCDKGSFEFADNTPPDTTITGNPTNPSSSTSATFTFTGSDNVTPAGSLSFQCQIDGGGFSACTSPRTYTGLSDGSHTFQVRAIDGAGNIDPTPASYTWIVDATPPNTTITANPTNPSASTTAGFSFIGNDGSGTGVASFQCQLDGGGFSTCTSPQTYTSLSQGSHTFLVRAVDGAGNVDPTLASYTWVIDTVAPNTTITANPTNPSASANASFSFTGSDPVGSGVAGFQCQIDGGGFSACTSPQTYTGLSDGSHTFQVRAIDAAGNVDPTPATFTWVIDTTGPDTTITANPTNPSASSSASFSFTGNDGSGSGVASFQCQIDGGGFSTCTSPQTYTGLSNGSHTFQVRAIDAVGNVDATPASYTWTINPITTTTAITSDTTDPSARNEAVTVTWTVTPAISGPAMTGNVTVSDGVNSCMDSVSAGQCNISLTTAGARTLTATYSGDSSYVGSSSAGVAHAVRSLIPLDFDGDWISDYAVVQIPGSFARTGKQEEIVPGSDILAREQQRVWTEGYEKLLHLRSGRGFVELPKDVQEALAKWREKGKTNSSDDATVDVVGGITWLIRRSSDGTTLNYTLGATTDKFVPADYDGDGKCDAAVWTPSTATFTVIFSSDSSTNTYILGTSTSDPTIVGDYDGDGRADPAVYDSSTGLWSYLGGATHSTLQTQVWMPNGIPAPGDYNGDGKYDFAVQLPPGAAPDSAKFRIAFNDGSVGPASDISMSYGLAIYANVPGDYDGDGITDIAQANLMGANIVWRVLTSSSSYTVQVKTTYGVVATDKTVQGDYDGDGKLDRVVHRTGSSPDKFFVRLFSGATVSFDWGDTNDHPVGFFNTH